MYFNLIPSSLHNYSWESKGHKIVPCPGYYIHMYITDLEETLIESRSLRPHLWVLYIDEVFSNMDA